VEDAEVMPVREPKKERRRDRKLATERRHQEPNCAPQKKLDVTRRGMIHHATAAWQKGKRMSCHATVARRMRDIFRLNTTHKGITTRKDRTRDNMVRGTLKQRMSGRRRQLQRKCKDGMRNQDVEELLHNCRLHRNSTLWRYQRPPE
jgi:hypothetical protein